MPLFLYSIPNWLLGSLISGLAVVFTLTGYWLFRRVAKHEFSDDERGLAMAVLGVVATINSLLLAFSAVSVWEAFGTAEDAVIAEGDTIAQLSRDLAVFGTPEADEARNRLLRYTRMVVDTEWPLMRAGEMSEETWVAADSTFRAIARLDPDTPKRVALLPEIWEKANEMVAHRRDRLQMTEAEVPSTLWLVVFAGTLLTMFTVFVLPATRFNITVIGGLAASMGLVFFFIIAMDRPFAGEESIGPEPFVSAIDNIERWDREVPD